MHNKSIVDGRLRRGSFADGEATANADCAQHVGTFSDGQADPDAYPEDGEVGTFADGEAQPDSYAGEDHEGTFAQTSRRDAAQNPVG
jgi:hypothetical protein